MSIIIRVAIEDDEAFLAPKKNKILPILIFPCGSAEETAGLFLTKNELLTPGCPESFQVKLLFLTFSSRLLFKYITKNFNFKMFIV